jgi:hypothetical protein
MFWGAMFVSVLSPNKAAEGRDLQGCRGSAVTAHRAGRIHRGAIGREGSLTLRARHGRIVPSPQRWKQAGRRSPDAHVLSIDM